MENPLSNDAAVHLETLQLLAEAAEYLGRLPPNPMTYQLKTKIEGYLSRPGANVRRERLASIAKDLEWRTRLDAGECFHGVSRFTPAGLPVVDCLVLRGTVHLRSPVHENAATRANPVEADLWARAIGREVAAGMSIQLGGTNKLILKSWPRIEPNTSNNTHALDIDE